MVKVKGAGPTKTVKNVKPAEKAKAEPVKAAKAEAKPAEPKKETADQQAARAAQADLDASVGRHPGGMEPPLSVEEEQARVAADFAIADGKGDPRWDEKLAGIGVRGY